MDFAHADLRLETPRLSVRTLTAADASPEHVAWLNDPEVNRYLETRSATLESVRGYLQEKAAKRDALFFGIFLKDGAKIGTLKLEPIDMERKKATLGIMIGEKDAWGKGYGSEAIRAAVNYSFRTLGLSEVNLGVIADNAGAMRAYEKVGFQTISRTKKQDATYGMLETITMKVTPETLIV